MKTLKIIGGASKNPIMILQNGDVLNSTWELLDESGKRLFYSEHCNRIPSKNLFGENQIKLHGILAPGNYTGIFTENIPHLGDGAVLQGVLPSIKINPSMGNTKTVSQIVCHSTNGDQGNGSEGCQTCYYKEFHQAYAGASSFEAQLKAGEEVAVEIIDMPEFTAYLLTL